MNLVPGDDGFVVRVCLSLRLVIQLIPLDLVISYLSDALVLRTVVVNNSIVISNVRDVGRPIDEGYVLLLRDNDVPVVRTNHVGDS